MHSKIADELDTRTRDVELPALVSQLHRDVGSGSLAADRESIRAAACQRAPWLGDDDIERLVARVDARLSGLGEVSLLLVDDSVTDVFVDGPGPGRRRTTRSASSSPILSSTTMALRCWSRG